MKRVLSLPVPLALAMLLTGGTLSYAQPQTTAGAPSPGQAASPTAAKPYTPIFPETTPYPVDIERVKEQAEQVPAVKLDDQQIRFYVLVVAKEPDFVEKWAKDYDFRNGPTRRGAAMSYNEFVNMVTPKELNELFGATSGSSFAMFQAALMNAAGQTLVKKALRDLHDARNEREVQAIRQRIDQELAALLGK